MTADATPNRRPVALITGASRGIGAHLARGFAAAGYDLALTARSIEALDSTVAATRECGARAEAYALEVTDADAVEAVVEQAVREFASIDVLINNAGVIEREHVVWESDPEEWWGVLEVNVRGPYLVSRAVVRTMVEQRRGRVIMLNSGSGGADSADLSAYNASKSALARITNAITLAGREHGVLAFDMAPGVVRTDMTGSMQMHVGRAEWTAPEGVVGLALALASGELDAWAGRMVRAGADTPAALRARAAQGMGDNERRLRWTSYGPEDPVC